MNKFIIWTSVLIFCIVNASWRSRSGIAIQMLDIGQGDSILVVTPNQTRILIDGGPDDSVLTELSIVSTYQKLDVDYVIVTHTDSDHIFGVITVSEYYSPKGYFLNLSPSTGKNASWWKEEAQDIHVGTVWEMDGVRFETLWPTREYLSSAKDPNNASVVTKITYGDFCGILTGDIEAGIEDKLVALYGEELDCDFLKVPHHGSKSSSTQEFLEAVSPSIAAISSGEENTYGHPHQEVLDRYQEAGIEVLRTDTLGRFTIMSDGQNIWWED